MRRLFDQCRRFETPLRRAFSCMLGVGDNNQPVRTTCDQSFARRAPDGSAVAVSPREAMDLQFSGTPVFLVDVETSGGAEARREQAEARQRAQQLQALSGELTQYLQAASPVVRAEATRLQGRINQQLAAQLGPSAATTEEILRDTRALGPLATAETARLSALERLAPLRALAEARTVDDASPALRARSGELRAAFKAVSESPRLAPAPRSPAEQQQLGPSFDCGKATKPLATLICDDPELRLLDIEMARPAYILRQLGGEIYGTVKAESQDLTARAVAACRLPQTGSVSPSLRARATPCIAELYRNQKGVWTERVGQVAPAGARQEVSRPIREHVRLQGLLRDAGLLPQDAVADGIYGGATRQAIITLAEAEGLPTDGFMSGSLADRLGRRSAVPPPGRTPYDPGLLSRIDALATRYQTYLTDLAEDQRDRSTRREAQARLDALMGRAKTLLAGILPDKLRADLGAAVQATRVSQPDPRAAVERLERAMDGLEPRLRDAETVQRAVTDRNRFLTQGSSNDIVLLYNSSPNAAAVARTLDGSLAFDAARMTACAVPEPIPDRFVQEQLRLKARGLGAPIEATVPPCLGSQARTADLLAVERGALLQEPGRFIAVASAVEAGVYALMGTLQDVEVQAARQSERDRSSEVSSAVERGTLGGFGLVGVPNSSRTICRIAAFPSDLHDRLLQPYRTLLERELDGELFTEPASAESAFQGAKRGRCGAIYASTSDLAVVTKALSRDGIAFRYLPVWIPAESAAPAVAAAPAESEPKALAQEAPATALVEPKRPEPPVESAPPPPETAVAPLQTTSQPALPFTLPAGESSAPPQSSSAFVPQPSPKKPAPEVVALLLQLQYLTINQEIQTQNDLDVAVHEFARDYNITVPEREDQLIERLKGAVMQGAPLGPCRTTDSSAGAVCIR